MSRGRIGSSLLLLCLAGTGGGLVAWKRAALQEADEVAASQPEPMEAITVATAVERQHRQSTTSIGTVLALRSITLRNELAGAVREVMLTPGAIVEEGTVLVALDVSVEEAELRAQEAEAAVAESMLGRMERASQNRGASEADVDRARGQRDVARAQVARTKAIIERKTVRAPFRARVGLADVHPGQYLNEGTELTTLQGVDEDVHVDFAVSQDVAANLSVGDELEISASEDEPHLVATIVALDARVDPATRNALVRARIHGAERAPTPGASVRVRIPTGPSRTAVAVPVSALRKGPAGDHVFVVEPDAQGHERAHSRRVESGPILGDEVLIVDGLQPGERVAASGSFKLHESVLVAIQEAKDASAGP